jgi:hypothetical protein
MNDMNNINTCRQYSYIYFLFYIYLQIMKKNDVALIVPVHTGKLGYVINIYNSFIKNKDYCDLYLVFTNEEEKNSISLYLDDNHYNSIIIPNNINHDVIKYKNIFATFKKFYGLEYIIKYNYKYSMCIDCDSEILNLSNISSVCYNFCQNKKIYGNIVIDDKGILKINNYCLFFLRDSSKKVINNKKIIKNIFFWFSQIPIYDMSLADKFLNFINFKNENYNEIINLLNWHSFEYIVYIYYCVLFHNYEIIDLSIYGININWSLELNLNSNIMKILELNNININWQSPNNLIDLDKHNIIYHIDRISYNNIFNNVKIDEYIKKYKIYQNFDLMCCDLFLIDNIPNLDVLFNILENSYASCVTYDIEKKIGYFKCSYHDIYTFRNLKIYDLKHQICNKYITIMKRKEYCKNIVFVPTYINHKNYYVELFNSLKFIKDDICFCVTFSSLKEMYEIQHNTHKKFGNIKMKFLIFDVEYNDKNKFSYQCSKKMWGWTHLEYDNLITLDSDFKFINDTNINDTISKYENKIYLSKPSIKLDIDVLNYCNNILKTNFSYFPLELPWIINKNNLNLMIKYLSDINLSIDSICNNNKILFEIILYRLFLLKDNLVEKTININKYTQKYNRNFLFDMPLNNNELNELEYDFAISYYTKTNEKYFMSIHNDR